MSSIPYDPTLVLGQIVQLEKIEALMAIAEAQKPLDLAFAKMNNVIKTSYKLKMIHTEMVNLGVEEDKLQGFTDELDTVMKKISKAAIEYGTTAVQVTDNVEKLKNKQAQKTISYEIESPMDYAKSTVTQFPLAFDSLTFDVQYVRNESNDQTDDTHARTIAKMHSDKQKNVKSGSNASSIINNVKNQTQNHKIDGTIVITAQATHKNADIIEPFVMDPEKAVTAWNYTYPKDKIKVDPQSIFKAALADFKGNPADKPALSIISGASRASSFVGFVHILTTEKTTSKDDSTSTTFAKQFEEKIKYNMWMNAAGGGYGESSSFAQSMKSMMSTSDIDCHCSLICEGIIPSIVCSEVVATVQSMDMDPETVMGQLSAIQDAGNSGVNSAMESQTEEGKRGGQFMSLNSEYMKNSVSNISDMESAANKVIDQNSLMTAFEDYITKAMAGESGIPVNFYIKRLVKNDIAKIYIRKFYPSGISDSKQAQRGQLGEAPAEGDGEGEG